VQHGSDTFFFAQQLQLPANWQQMIYLLVSQAK
jgi:hypothetical protein